MKEQQGQKAFYDQLGANIRERRKALNLSQDVLARSIGLTRTSLTNIENGRQHPPLHTFCEIIDQLKIDAAALLPQRAVREDANGALQASAAQQTRNPDELAFITAAIGLRKQETTDGDTQKKNRGAGKGASAGKSGVTGSGARNQDRQGKGRTDRY